MQDEMLREQIETADRSLFFLTVLVGSILLSWLTLARQRQELCTKGQAAEARPARLESSVLVVVALSWFFCLGVKGRKGGTRSSEVNFWASLLVLLAALLRLWDLWTGEQEKTARAA